jgi:Lar family restriction alleviation protein
MTRPDHTAVPPADVIAAAELKPCPFCGGREASVCERDHLHFVMCDNCTAEGPAIEGVQSRIDAAKEWNRRAEGAAPTAAQAAGRSDLVAELRESLRWALRRIETANLGMGDHFARADAVLVKADTASHAPNATLSASHDAEFATSGATSAAKVEVDVGELVALRRDAARYRWARDEGCNFVWAEIGAGNFRTGLDGEIDRAMAKSK